MFGLKEKEKVKRNWLIYGTARFLSNRGYKLFSRVHTENPYELGKLKNNNSVFLYVGLHRSLWETTGVLSSMFFQRLPIPFSAMGDNLVKGKFFQWFTSKTGLFLVKRAKTRREIVESSKKLKQYIMYYIANNTDVVIYPEGTRRTIPEKGEYGPYFPTAFEALLEYERDKEKILAEYPQLKPLDVYVVPFNTDYSKIREDFEIIGEMGKRPRTFRIIDSLKLLRKIGDIHISFGEPIRIKDHLDKNRKQLALMSREKCLELVRILPINVAGRAIALAIKKGDTSENTILDYIKKTVEELDHLKDRFRGFKPGDPPKEILDKVAKYERLFRKIDPEELNFYRLYANYIHHYLDSV